MKSRLLFGGGFLLAALLALTGCGRTKADKISYGWIDGEAYHNDFFGLRMQLPEGAIPAEGAPKPEGWLFEDLAERSQRIQVSGRIAFDAKVDPDQKSTLNLVTLSHPPTGTWHDFRPAFSIVAENVLDRDRIIDGSDFFAWVREGLTVGTKGAPKVNMKIEFPKPVTKTELGGLEFHTFDVQYTSRVSFTDPETGKTETAERTIRQTQYCRIMRDYALVIILSSTSEAEGEMTRALLERVTFE